jgi:hypothetical protein
MIRPIFVIPVLASAGLAVSAAAHHSFSMFDASRTVTLNGVVKEFQWTNPHSWIELEAKRNGQVQNWSIETSSPLGLKRNGWSKQSLKAGDEVSVVIHPLKDGRNGGSLVSVTTADKKTLLPVGVGS